MKENNQEQQITTPETIMNQPAHEMKQHHIHKEGGGHGGASKKITDNNTLIFSVIGVLVACVICFLAGIQVGKSSYSQTTGPGSMNMNGSSNQMGPPGMNGQFQSRSNSSSDSSDDTSVQ